MLHIITDSSAEIPAWEAEALGVTIVPLTVIFGDTPYLDGVELQKEEFYRRLIGGEFPHTAQPSPAQFEEAFRACEGEEALVLLIASALSGTAQAARLAAKEFPNVHIYETNCTTCMLRFLVEEAVANRTRPLSEVVARLDDLRPRIRLHACLDTLEYLSRGGRINKAVARLGDLIKIKPLVGVSADGHVVMTGRAHGQKRAIKEISERFASDMVCPDHPVYFLQTQPDDPTRALMEACGQENARIFRICCAVGAHIGPNAAGIAYVVK